MKYKFKPLTMLMIETSLVCNSFVATSNNSKSSLTFFYDVFKNFIFLFVEKSPEKFNNEQLFRLKYKECLNSYFSI